MITPPPYYKVSNKIFFCLTCYKNSDPLTLKSERNKWRIPKLITAQWLESNPNSSFSLLKDSDSDFVIPVPTPKGLSGSTSTLAVFLILEQNLFLVSIKGRKIKMRKKFSNVSWNWNYFSHHLVNKSANFLQFKKTLLQVMHSFGLCGKFFFIFFVTKIVIFPKKKLILKNFRFKITWFWMYFVLKIEDSFLKTKESVK